MDSMQRSLTYSFARTDLSELQTGLETKSIPASLNTLDEFPFHRVCPQPVIIQRLPGLKKLKLSGKQIWLMWRPNCNELDNLTRAEK